MFIFSSRSLVSADVASYPADDSFKASKKICELILPCKANNFRPPVASRSLKSSKHAKRGIRIFSVNSLISWISAQPTDNTQS